MSRATRAAYAATTAAPATEEPQSMQIKFDAVTFERTINRIGGSKGLASSDTAFFSATNGLEITLDVAAQLVTISKGPEEVNVPACRVLHFGRRV